MPGAVEEAQVGTGERSGDSLDVDVTERVDTTQAGDDIAIVIPDPEHPTHKHGVRVAIIAGVAVVVLIAIGAWVIGQGTKDKKVITQNAAPTPPAQQPVPSDVVGNQPTSAPNVSSPNASTPPSVTRTTNAPTRNNGGTNTPVVPPQQPTGPKTSPLSALVWSGSKSISVHSGDTKTITISVTNPTGGTVSLPNPLSCPSAWKLTDSPVCAQMVQQIAPGAHLTTTVTIDATGATAGKSYSTSVGGAYTITVTVN